MDCYGNLAPLTKAGQQLILNFYAFKENRLPFCVKVRQGPEPGEPGEPGALQVQDHPQGPNPVFPLSPDPVFPLKPDLYFSVKCCTSVTESPLRRRRA